MSRHLSSYPSAFHLMGGSLMLSLLKVRERVYARTPYGYKVRRPRDTFHPNYVKHWDSLSPEQQALRPHDNPHLRWRIIPEGQPIPQVHRKYVVNVEGEGHWYPPSRCHSTMTPPTAQVWGDVAAYAEVANP
jgi:hypothetical protein